MCIDLSTLACPEWLLIQVCHLSNWPRSPDTGGQKPSSGPNQQLIHCHQSDGPGPADTLPPTLYTTNPEQEASRQLESTLIQAALPYRVACASTCPLLGLPVIWPNSPSDPTLC